MLLEQAGAACAGGIVALRFCWRCFGTSFTLPATFVLRGRCCSARASWASSWAGKAALPVAGAAAATVGLRRQAMIQGLAFMSHQIGSFLGAFYGGGCSAGATTPPTPWPGEGVGRSAWPAASSVSRSRCSGHRSRRGRCCTRKGGSHGNRRLGLQRMPCCFVADGGACDPELTNFSPAVHCNNP